MRRLAEKPTPHLGGMEWTAFDGYVGFRSVL